MGRGHKDEEALRQLGLAFVSAQCPSFGMARPTRLIRQAARQLRHLTRANGFA